MTAALFARLDGIRPPTVFFDALAEADARIADTERLEREASFAPPVTTIASCVCGSVFEARENRIEIAPEEADFAAEAVADMFGRGPLDDLDPLIVARVIDAVNHARAQADHDAMRDWQDTHYDCEDDHEPTSMCDHRLALALALGKPCDRNGYTR